MNVDSSDQVRLGRPGPEFHLIGMVFPIAEPDQSVSALFWMRKQEIFS